MEDAISPSGFLASEGLEDWRVLSDGACACFPVSSFAEAARFVQAMSALPGLEGHPPDVDLRPDAVTVRLVTLTAGYMGMTARDVDLGRRISAVARESGLTSDPSRLQSFLIVPGAPSIAAIQPFWQAALGYDPRPDSPEEDLVDPANRGPAIWLEQMQEPRGDGGGAVHVAVWLPREQAKERIAAAVAAGGRIVRDDYAPAWVTLADAAGNEVDISTVHGRPEE